MLTTTTNKSSGMGHLVKKCAPHFAIALVLFHIDSDDLPFPIAHPHRVWHGPDYKPIHGQSSPPVLAAVTREDVPEPLFSPSRLARSFFVSMLPLCVHLL